MTHSAVVTLIKNDELVDRGVVSPNTRRRSVAVLEQHVVLGEEILSRGGLRHDSREG